MITKRSFDNGAPYLCGKSLENKVNWVDAKDNASEDGVYFPKGFMIEKSLPLSTQKLLSGEIKRGYFRNVASSSRFAVSCLLNYGEDIFEKILNNSDIVKPHLDANFIYNVTFKVNGA